jgi:hypothetical protein
MKDQLDAVARALHDWPEGSRNAYTPHSLAGMVTALRQRLERAEGARDRLRVALKDIIEGRDGMLHVCDDPEDGCADLWNEFIEAGRAALADKGATDAE